MAAHSTGPVRQARIDRAKDIIGDALSDQRDPPTAGPAATVIYMTGCTVTFADPAARPATMVPEPA